MALKKKMSREREMQLAYNRHSYLQKDTMDVLNQPDLSGMVDHILNSNYPRSEYLRHIVARTTRTNTLTGLRQVGPENPFDWDDPDYMKNVYEDRFGRRKRNRKQTILK